VRYVIVGCGRLGAILATALAEEHHEVAIIDRDADAFRRLGRLFSGRCVAGVAFDRAILERASISSADGFATMTSGDNANFVLAAMARWRYRVPRVVARIYDPVRADIYSRLGIATVSPTSWGAARVKELLRYERINPLLHIANGDIEVVEDGAGVLLDGRTAAELMVTESVQLVAVVRDGRGLIPTASTLLRTHDVLQIAVRGSARRELADRLGIR